MEQVPKRTETKSAKSSKSDLNIRKIMVAVDLSPHSEKTVAYAAKFARSLGASITLVHVFPPEPTTEFTSVRAHEVFEEGRWRMLGKLTKLTETIQQTGVECGDDFRVGDPAEEVVLAAQSVNADLIVTASHGPGLFGRVFGLDQASRILHRATCPVLVYHEETGEQDRDA